MKSSAGTRIGGSARFTGDGFAPLAPDADRVRPDVDARVDVVDRQPGLSVPHGDLAGALDVLAPRLNRSPGKKRTLIERALQRAGREAGGELRFEADGGRPGRDLAPAVTPAPRSYSRPSICMSLASSGGRPGAAGWSTRTSSGPFTKRRSWLSIAAIRTSVTVRSRRPLASRWMPAVAVIPRSVLRPARPHLRRP